VSGSNQPESIPVSEGRARLTGAGYTLMDGGNDPRFEIWLDENGCPHIINYVGPPYNPIQRFLKKDIDELVPIN